MFCRLMLKIPPPVLRVSIQIYQKCLLRNDTKADGHKHTNDDCVVPVTTTAMIAHVVMEMKSACALLRQESCLEVRKEEESGS